MLLSALIAAGESVAHGPAAAGPQRAGAGQRGEHGIASATAPSTYTGDVLLYLLRLLSEVSDTDPTVRIH